MSIEQVVFAPSWGRRFAEPGIVNEALARRISTLVGDRVEEFLIFAQWEVADALMHERIAADHVVWQPPYTQYITTKYVLREMCEEVRVHGFYTDFQYFLVTHPLHAERSREVLLELGIPKRQLFCLECEEIYDPLDIHPWTWSKDAYHVYESCYRLLSKFLPI